MSYTRLLYHIVFRPRSSRPVITIVYEEMLYRYLWGFVKNKGGVLYRIGGMPDHVHMLVQIPPTLALSDFMHDLKLSANKFMSEHTAEFPDFEGWGKSYCALTCSESVKDSIIEYIRYQKDHHKRTSFRDEYLKLLQENGIAGVESKYLFGK